MGTVGENITRLRDLRGWSKAELGERAGMNRENVSQYERGIRQPKFAAVKAIASALGVAPWDIDPRVPPPPPGNAEPVGLRTVPLYGFGNAAPSARELTGDVVPDDERHLDRVSVTDPSVIAAFKVTGQSMEADGITDGSVVLCRAVPSPKELPNGAIVVCKIDDVLYCKHWRRVGRTILLTSSSPGGKDIELTGRAPEWVLQAVDLIRHLNGRT